MSRTDYFIIWLVATVVLAAVGFLFPQPGYMDAYYYYHVAENVAQGKGLVEDFVWNYLPPPETILHSSSTYWMPLVSLIAAPFMAVFGTTFRAAQLPFVLLSSVVPVMIAAFVWRMTLNKPYAIWSASFSLFGGFYLTHWVDIDSFGTYAISAGAAVFIMGEICASYRVRLNMSEGMVPVGDTSTTSTAYANVSGTKAEAAPSYSLQRTSGRMRSGSPGAVPSRIIAAQSHRSTGEAVAGGRRPLLLAAPLGLLAAIGHLSRPDAPLLLVVFGLALLLTAAWRRVLPALAVAVSVYILAMAPWFLRNIYETGTPLSSYGVSLMFMREYDDLYSYGASFSPGYFFERGLWNIIADKINALWTNLVVLQGGTLFLVPFISVGAWSFRKEARMLPLYIYGVLLYLTFSLLFTHPGARGSMVHSAVALLPWTSFLAVHGIYTAVAWVAYRRDNWKRWRAQLSFTGIALFFSAFLSVYVAFYERGERAEILQGYVNLSGWVDSNVVAAGPIMLANPPVYAYVSQRPSVSTPSNGVQALLAAADRYGVSLLALENDHARKLDPLYYGSESHPRLDKIGEVGTTRIYLIKPREEDQGR